MRVKGDVDRVSGAAWQSGNEAEPLYSPVQRGLSRSHFPGGRHTHGVVIGDGDVAAIGVGDVGGAVLACWPSGS